MLTTEEMHVTERNESRQVKSNTAFLLDGITFGSPSEGTTHSKESLPLFLMLTLCTLTYLPRSMLLS